MQGGGGEPGERCGPRGNPRAWEGQWVLFPRLCGAKISSTNPKPSDPQREVATFHSEVTRAKKSKNKQKTKEEKQPGRMKEGIG